MDKPVQMTVGTILMVVLLFVAACGMAIGIMKLMVPATVAQIGANQQLVTQVNEAFTRFEPRVTAIETRLDALERRGKSVE